MSDRLIILHEDAFSPFFDPFLPDGAEAGAFGGLGLIPGRDWRVMQQLPETQVWTVTEADGEWWINPGITSVSRHCYLTTKRPHDFRDVAFRSSRRRPFLTALGLRRQLTVLDRLYS